MTAANPLATIVVIGSKPGQCGGLLAGNLADLGHAHQDGDRGRQPGAADAVDQIEPLGEVAMRADRRHQGLQFDPLALLKAGQAFLPELLDTRVAAALKPVLYPRDIFANLIDQRQLLGERQQSRIGRGVDIPDRSRAGRDQSRIDLVFLGPLPLEPGVGSHLRRLEHHHDKSFAPQLGDNGLLIAATRLDADTLNPMPPKPIRQHLVTLNRVVDLQQLRTAIDRHVELPFAGIDPGTDHGTLGHLRRPFLVYEPSVPSTMRVPMKCRSRSRYDDSPKRLRWASIRSIGGPARAATRAGPFLRERGQYNASR